MIFLLVVVLLVSVAFLLYFLTALKVESQDRSERMSMHKKTRFFATGSDVAVSKSEMAGLRSDEPRFYGERAVRIVVAVIAIVLCAYPLRAQEAASSSNGVSADEVRELRQLVQELKAKVDRLEQNAPRQPATQNAPSELKADPVVPDEALVAETGAASSQATTPEKPKKAEPFAYADWTWLSGNPRKKTPDFDSTVFTREIRDDDDYVLDFRRA